MRTPEEIRQAREQKGWAPLKFDVRDIAVPEKWQGCDYEYRHGYGTGLERDGATNPISHRAESEAVRDDLPRPRSAWRAGYEAGKKARRVR